MAWSRIKNRRFRSTALQVGFLAGIVLVIVTAILTARTNLAAQGMTAGLAFLERSTGWNIGFSLIPYGPGDTYLTALWVGFINTLFLSAITIPLATLIGIVVAVMRTSGDAVFELIGATYVEIFRNIPLLLQLLFWYTVLTSLPGPREAISPIAGIFISGRGIAVPWLNASAPAILGAVAVLVMAAGLRVAMALNLTFRRQSVDKTRMFSLVLWGGALALAALLLWSNRVSDAPMVSIPQLQGLRFRGGATLSPELASCVIAISIYGGAFIAEIMRAGLQSVAGGQVEASRALGLKPLRIFTRIRFPLAIRAVMPILANQYIWLTKATTLGIAVGFADYYMVISTSINQSGRTLELIALLMLGFLVINYALAFVLNRVNDAIRLKGTGARA